MFTCISSSTPEGMCTATENHKSKSHKIQLNELVLLLINEFNGLITDCFVTPGPHMSQMYEPRCSDGSEVCSAVAVLTIQHCPLTWFPANSNVPGVGLGRYGMVAPLGGD